MCGFWWLCVLGVSGGTASGKTTVCDMIIQQLHDHRVVLVNQVFILFLNYLDVWFFLKEMMVWIVSVLWIN